MSWPWSKSNINNIVFMGVPRSGTTLACTLLNQLPNTVALIEPVMNDKTIDVYSLKDIDQLFSASRKSLLKNGIASSQLVKGKVSDNAFGESEEGKRELLFELGEIKVEKELGSDFTLLIKHNRRFVIHLPEIANRYPCFGMVRNPLAMLSSWNTVNLPVSSGDMSDIKDVEPELIAKLESLESLLDRQICILDWFFTKLDALGKSRIIRYEEMIASKGQALSAVLPQAKGFHFDFEEKESAKMRDMDMVTQIGERLLQAEGHHAMWKYYSKQDIQEEMKL